MSSERRCYWDDWDWQDFNSTSPETTGSTGTPDPSGCEEIVCEQFYRPKIDKMYIIPTSIIEVYFEY